MTGGRVRHELLLLGLLSLLENTEIPLTSTYK